MEVEPRPSHAQKVLNYNLYILREGSGHGRTHLQSQLLRRLWHKDLKFEACLGCIVSSRPAWVTWWDLVSKEK
jgi:hypothetical protein